MEPKKDYCVNDVHHACQHCPLANYSRDCRNVPINTPEKTDDHVSRIKKAAKTGHLHHSFRAVMEAIPPGIIDRLTVQEAALLVDSIWQSWQTTKRLHAAEILAEGAIFDPLLGEMLEIREART